MPLPYLHTPASGGSRVLTPHEPARQIAPSRSLPGSLMALASLPARSAHAAPRPAPVTVPRDPPLGRPLDYVARQQAKRDVDPVAASLATTFSPAAFAVREAERERMIATLTRPIAVDVETILREAAFPIAAANSVSQIAALAVVIDAPPRLPMLENPVASILGGPVGDIAVGGASSFQDGGAP